MLTSVRLPEGAERVAVSLDHPVEGPFLIVTREGRFVTCLGPGMRTSDLPIVTRGELDSITAKMATYRARVEVRDKLLGKGGELGAIMQRIILAGPDLSREELMAIATVQPLLAVDFYKLLIDLTRDAEESRTKLVSLLQRSRKVKRAHHPAFKAHWMQVWSVGHLAVLTSLGGPEALGLGKHDPPFEIIFSICTVRQGIGAIALKGAWAVAQVGEPALDHYKKLRVKASSHTDMIEATVALYALGLRHPELRTEVREALSQGTDPDLSELATVLRLRVFEGFDKPEEAAKEHQRIGASLLSQAARAMDKKSPYHFKRPEDVPGALAMSFGANYRDEFLYDTKALDPLFKMIPWVTRVPPEELYLPADLIKAASPPWQPKQTVGLLSGFAELERLRLSAEPAEPEGPSRSGPCPCGSGRKYKRCCGAKA